MRSNSGFTLVELMVVMAIVAILSAVAIPAYTRYVQRGDLVEGTQALAQYRVQMEQYYQDNRNYANGQACGVVLPVLVNFTVTCATANNGQTYTGTATAKAISPINGFIYTIDQSNNQQTTGIAASWGAMVLPANSWIVR